MQKRGMSNQTIIMMIVGALVLLGIILGVIFLGGEEEANVNPIIEQCASQCEAGSIPGFCSMQREVEEGLSLTCNSLATNSQYSSYDVEACSAISCTSQESSPSSQTCISLDGEWETPAVGGDCVQDSDKIKRKITSSDDAPEAGQICCR